MKWFDKNYMLFYAGGASLCLSLAIVMLASGNVKIDSPVRAVVEIVEQESSRARIQKTLQETMHSKSRIPDEPVEPVATEEPRIEPMETWENEVTSKAWEMLKSARVFKDEGYVLFAVDLPAISDLDYTPYWNVRTVYTDGRVLDIKHTWEMGGTCGRVKWRLSERGEVSYLNIERIEFEYHLTTDYIGVLNPTPCYSVTLTLPFSKPYEASLLWDKGIYTMDAVTINPYNASYVFYNVENELWLADLNVHGRREDKYTSNKDLLNAGMRDSVFNVYESISLAGSKFQFQAPVVVDGWSLWAGIVADVFAVDANGEKHYLIERDAYKWVNLSEDIGVTELKLPPDLVSLHIMINLISAAGTIHSEPLMLTQLDIDLSSPNNSKIQVTEFTGELASTYTKSYNATRLAKEVIQ